MPNYIKNRLSFYGPIEDINQLISRFGTSYERSPKLTFDGRQIFTHKETGDCGWLDIKSGQFERRNMPNVNDIPDGFEQDFDEAWTRFPDFNKIIPMPKGMESNPHSGISIWIEICTGQINFSRNVNLDSMNGILGNMKTGSAIKALESDKNVATLSDEEFEMFIQGIKNYREHGFVSWYEWSIKHWGTKWNCSECEKIDENVFEFQTAWSGVPDLIEKMSCEFPSIKITYEWSDEDTGCNCGIGQYHGDNANLIRLENSSKEAYELCFKLWPHKKENYQLVGDTYEYVELEED